MRGRRNGGNVGKVRNVARLMLLRLPTFLTFLRRVAGMPDYVAHVEHLRRCHPGQPVPTERQFYDEFTRARYGDGPTRCC
jgi:uncharacterized short protein YbdD (DUF466 family)